MSEIDRRVLLGGVAAMPAMAASRASAEPVTDKTFVLVHGAWHGGWCWERTADRLRTAGARVYAPTLTGLCERAHLLSDDIDLTTHIEDVIGELRWKDLSGVTLVGHSYGGMVITGVAERETARLRSIVYLDAMLPQDGQALRDVTGTRSPPPTEPIPPFPASTFVAARDVDWVQTKMTPQPYRTFTQPVSNTGAIYRLENRTYIQATIGATPFFTAAYERTTADPRWRTHRLESHHDAMLDQPDQLTALLLDA